MQGPSQTSGWLPVNHKYSGAKGGACCQSYLSGAAYQQVWDGKAGGWHRRQQKAKRPRQGACGTGSSAAAPQCLMPAASPSCSCPILLLLPACAYDCCVYQVRSALVACCLQVSAGSMSMYRTRPQEEQCLATKVAKPVALVLLLSSCTGGWVTG